MRRICTHVLTAAAIATVLPSAAANAQEVPALDRRPEIKAELPVSGAGPSTMVALGYPAMTPPLMLNAAPIAIAGGPLGTIHISGQFTGLALTQTAAVPDPLSGAGNRGRVADVGAAMVTAQSTGRPFTFVVQAGAYSLPTLGAPYIRAGKTLDAYFGPVPVAYGKYAINEPLSVQIGSMPTLIGSENAFTYQNTSIEHGLVTLQEPTFNKGVQVNYVRGPLILSAAISDGFYSDRYNWLTGLATYAINPFNTISIDGGLSLTKTEVNTLRSPRILNNSGIVDLSYTHTRGPFNLNAYVQYTKADRDVGRSQGAETYSAAAIASYRLSPEYALGGRAEYTASSTTRCRRTDGPTCAPTNLLFGPGSSAWSLSLTPTWQRGTFFARAEVSYVRLEGFTRGFGFGPRLGDGDQVRGLLETGVLF